MQKRRKRKHATPETLYARWQRKELLARRAWKQALAGKRPLSDAARFSELAKQARKLYEGAGGSK